MTLWTIARFIPIARPRADGTGPLTLTGRWEPQPDRWGTFATFLGTTEDRDLEDILAWSMEHAR